MDLVQPSMLKTKTQKDFQALLRKDLKAVAKKFAGKPLRYVAAKDVVLVDKKRTSIVVVVRQPAEVEAWETALEAVKATVLTGKCEVSLDQEKTIHVSLTKFVGGTHEAVTKIVAKALKFDPKLQAHDTLAKADDAQPTPGPDGLPDTLGAGVTASDIERIVKDLGLGEDVQREIEANASEFAAEARKFVEGLPAEVGRL